MYTRRDIGRIAFGTAAVAAWPVSRAFGDESVRPGATTVRLGATTWSLRDLPRIPGENNTKDLIGPLRNSGVREIDLWSYNTEPAGPNFGPAAPPPPAAYPIVIHHFTPEEISEAKLAARKLLRDFRMNAPAGHYENMRVQFASAGISVTAYTVNYDESFTDDEVDITFRQAKALGAKSITAPGNAEIAKRLTPFAEKHQIDVSLTDPSLVAALPSRRFKVNLDIGAMTGANGSPVAYIQENHDSIGQVLIKDRRRNKGKSEQFGDGDTPIADVLRLVKEKKYTFPVFAEYEYIGLGTPGEELRRCMDYMRSAIA